MTDPLLVHLSSEIEASPETVWSILTTPELFSKWMDGTVSFDATPGSPFRAEFPNFQTVIAGELVTVDGEARHFGVTWGIESGPNQEAFPAGCSLVEFRVHEADVGCRVEVTHSQLPSETAVHEHEGGWRFHLSRMALVANRHDLEAGFERTLPAWFAAWNEQDPLAREESLRACCTDDVVFQDDWTAASGIEGLVQHISMCFMFMPGWTLEPTGEVRICRGEALIGWKSTGPAGMVEGFNHVKAAPDGTLHHVTGFQAS